MENNMRQPLTNNSNHVASPHETGVGEINPVRALNPGLVFETTVENYLDFLCHYGYSEKNIRSMSGAFKFSCPNPSLQDLISDINYPSISIAGLDRRRSPERTVQRTVTNVGPTNSTYTAEVRSPKGLVVKVRPEKLAFSEGRNRVPFEVSFDGREAPRGYGFGSVTWSDGRHSVRVVFSVNVE